jgi:hypothetical protein
MSDSLTVPEIITLEEYEVLFLASIKKYFMSDQNIKVPESARSMCFLICLDLLGLEESACAALVDSVPETVFGSVEYRTLWHHHAGEPNTKQRVGGFCREQLNCVIRKYNSLIVK